MMTTKGVYMKTLIIGSILLFSYPSIASTSTIDIISSADPYYEIIVITIDGCDTVFKIPKKDFKELNNPANSRVIKDMISKAKNHALSGCGND